MKWLLSALAVGGLGGVLAGLPGCTRDCDKWSEPEPLALGVDADLLAVAIDPSWDGEGNPRFHAVGADGVIVRAGESITSESPVAADLRGVAYHREYVIAVGDAGTIVRAPFDGSGAWETVNAGVTDDLYAVTSYGTFALAVGDDAVIVHDSGADTWIPAPPPGGGWGSLRASFRDPSDASYWLVGLDGVAWSAREPQGPWTRADLGTDADLLAVDGDPHVYGSEGTILDRRDGMWRAIGSGADVDFISAAVNGALLTADGRLVRAHRTTGALQWNVELDPGMTAIATLEGEEELGGDTSAIVVGAGGRAVRLDYTACEVFR